VNTILRAVKATYNFFAGDAIILTAVVLAFVLTALLLDVANAPMPLTALLFVATLMAGLVATLGREVAGRPRRGPSPSGWSDLGDVDLDTGMPAAGPVDGEDYSAASFPDGNNAVGTLSDTGVPTGLPFPSALQRRMQGPNGRERSRLVKTKRAASIPQQMAASAEISEGTHTLQRCEKEEPSEERFEATILKLDDTTAERLFRKAGDELACY